MSETELRSASAVIDALGGNRAVADLTDSTPGAVSNWRGFGKFPANTFRAMTIALRAIGLTAPASMWGQKGAVEASESEPVA